MHLAQQFERTSRDCDIFRRLSVDQNSNAPHMIVHIQDRCYRGPLGSHACQDGEASSFRRRERPPLPPSPSLSSRKSRPFCPFIVPVILFVERTAPVFFFVFFCGRRNHAQQECAAARATCFSCSRAGHFTVVCRSCPRGDRDQRQQARPAGRGASVSRYHRRRGEPNQTWTPVQGVVTVPDDDDEFQATICTVASPDGCPPERRPDRPLRRCHFCRGRPHPRCFCPASPHVACFSWGKWGHFYLVCESRPQWPRLDRGRPSNPSTRAESGYRRHQSSRSAQAMRRPLAPRAPRFWGGRFPPGAPSVRCSAACSSAICSSS